MTSAKLGDICTIVSGGTPSRSKSEYWNDGTVPWIKISDIKGKYVNKTDESITELGLEKSSAKLLRKGTILYTIFATLGEVGILNIDACTNQAIAGITINKSNSITTNYLYYYLKSKKEYVNNIGRGVAQNNINLSILRKFEVPVPSAEEQKEIVSTLETLQSIITHRRTQLEKLDLLVKARFVEMFGDTEVNSNDFPIKKLCNVCTVSSSKRIYQEEQSSSGVPFLRISNLVELIDNDKFGSDLFIPEEKYNELLENGLVPQKGDILVTSRGTLGKCYIVRDNDRFYFQDGMISWLYDIDKSITPLYLTLLFDTRDIKRQIDNIQSGSTVAYLSITMLKKLDIVVPPIELQQQFADFVKQVDKSKATVQKALDEAQLLFDSLMQEYFG